MQRRLYILFISSSIDRSIYYTAEVKLDLWFQIFVVLFRLSSQKKMHFACSLIGIRRPRTTLIHRQIFKKSKLIMYYDGTVQQKIYHYTKLWRV